MRFDREARTISGGRSLYLYRFHDEEDQHKKQERAWGSVASGWNEEAQFVETWLHNATKLLLEPMATGSGDLLDLGCGARSMTIPSNWRQIGLDLSHQMIARRRNSIRGSFDELPFKSHSFGAVISRLGLMFAPDPELAIRESLRVLKPEGVLAFAVWGDPQRNLWSTRVSELLCNENGLEPALPTEPSAFRLSRRPEVEIMLQKTGFLETRVAAVEIELLNQLSPEEIFDRLNHLAGPIHLLYERVPEERKPAVREQILSVLAASDRSGSIDVWCAVKPKSQS
ncbi:MAG: class I SAM-dependent methyltransferase [Fimbriimonadales bacterium]